MIKLFSLICLFLVPGLLAGVFACGQSDTSAKTSGKQAEINGRTYSPPARATAFFHPETGELLTYEEWKDLGLESDEAAEASVDDTAEPQNSQTELRGRKVDLGDGDYVIVVDNPDLKNSRTGEYSDEREKENTERGE